MKGGFIGGLTCAVLVLTHFAAEPAITCDCSYSLLIRDLCLGRFIYLGLRFWFVLARVLAFHWP